MIFMKKAVLAGALGAATLITATPAMADDWAYRRHHDGDTAGAAVAGGIIGLALGAAIASGSRDRYYDDGYYYRHRPRARVYVYQSYPRYYGGYDRRYYRHHHPRGYYGNHYYGGHRGYYRGW